MYEKTSRPKKNKIRTVAQNKMPRKQSLALLDNRSGRTNQNQTQQSGGEKFLKHPLVMQRYFGIKGDNTLFGLRRVNSGTISKIRRYLEKHHPELLANFVGIDSDNNSKNTVCLQDWLEKNNISIKKVEFDSIQNEFPQTKGIPFGWVSSTTSHNPGGPPLLLNPPELQSPTSSQEEDIAIDEYAVKSTDLVIDITPDHFKYHRTQKDYPITPVNRSELRAGAALTNSFVDQSSTSLVGKGTAPIRTETDKIRKEARGQNPSASSSKTFSHHPDTFWTGKPYSEMGWHPVDKNTNTLEGDANNLPSQIGRNLSGILLKEKNGYTRPTLESISLHENRCEAVRGMLLEPSSGLSSLRKKIDSAKEFVTTKNAMARWSALEAVIERLEIAERENEHSLSDIARYYLAMTYAPLPSSTSVVNELLEDIYLNLLSL